MSALLLVADSGPMIALARLDLLAIPSRVFDETLVTATVWHEVIRAPRPAEHAALSAAHAAGLFRIVDDPTALPPVLANDLRLDDGERSAVALAVAWQATVFMDERHGRAAAAAMGLHVLGTLGLLIRARNEGLIDRLRPHVDALVDSGYFLAQRLIDQALAAVGE